MAQGTGLPLPKRNGVTTSTSIDMRSAAALSAAPEWNRIAEAGDRISRAGFSYAQKEIDLQDAGMRADFENDHRQQFIDARDRFAGDPEGFKNWAQAHTDGAVGQVPERMIPHAKRYLGGMADANYSAILGEKRRDDDVRATESLKARRLTAAEDVMGMAAAGKVGTPEFQAAMEVHNAVLDTAVASGKMAPEMAEYAREDLTGQAQGEMASRAALNVYREKGFDAAVEFLTRNVRENDALSLKSSTRDKIFNKGLASIRLEQGRLKEDRVAAVDVSKDVISRIDANVDVDPGEIREVAAELSRTGAFREYRTLMVKAGIADATREYRPGGGKTLPQLGADVARMRGELSPELTGAIEAAAFKRGVPADYLVRTVTRESGGDPNAKATTSTAGGYFGFIDQTWLAQFKNNGASIGLADLAGKIEKDGNRYVVSDPRARQQILALRGDAVVSSELAASLTAQNAASLRGVLGREPSAGELYAAHFLGAEGAATMLRADRGAVAATINPAAAAANYSIFYRKDGTPKTVGEVVGNITSLPEPSGTALGDTAKGVQKFYVEQQRKVWPQMKGMIERGELTDVTEFEALRYAAKVSGDTGWSNEVEAFATAQGYGRLLKDVPVDQQRAFLDRVRVKLESEGATVNGQQILTALEKQYERQVKMAKDDPIGLAVETDPNVKVPDPLNLSSPAAAGVGIGQRVTIARQVAASKDTPLGSALREADRLRLAGAIGGGQPQEVIAAFGALNAVPDDMFVQTLDNKDLKEAVAGAARSADPVRFGAVMSGLDVLYAREPQTFTKLFGEETWHRLKTWQANLRYLGPEKVAEELRRVEDPQQRERRDAAESAGRKEARKKDAGEVVKAFDDAWFSDPVAPTDPATRDALMGDYETIFARRYHETGGNADKAHEQAVELMKTRWSRSGVNGGQLMLHAPEKHYPTFGESHDWMRSQLETELAARYGAQSTANVGTGLTDRNWTYAIIADRRTDTDAANRRPPSYQVVVTNMKTGEADVVRGDDRRPLRWTWTFDQKDVDAEEQFRVRRGERAQIGSPFVGVP
jgi:hypothetical protein